MKRFDECEVYDETAQRNDEFIADVNSTLVGSRKFAINNSQKMKLREHRGNFQGYLDDPFKYMENMEMEVNGKRVPFDASKKQQTTRIFLHGKEIVGRGLIAGNTFLSRHQTKYDAGNITREISASQMIVQGLKDLEDQREQEQIDEMNSWMADNDENRYYGEIDADKAEEIYLDPKSHETFDNLKGYEDSLDERKVRVNHRDEEDRFPMYQEDLGLSDWDRHFLDWE